MSWNNGRRRHRPPLSGSRPIASPAHSDAGLPWSPAHPVLEVLRARRAAGSKPGARDDGLKVGLAIEGGGLRGVVSGAMLTAVEDLGFADAFDDVYACSSGAVNGAYFIARRTWFPLSIYFDDLTDPAFLDFRRVLRREGPMNLAYVFEEVLVRRKPLDYAAIIAAAQRLHVMVTDVDALKTLDVSDFSTPDDVREALRASTWLPLAIKGTTTFRGHRAIDGGVLRFHPFRAAVEDRCTHVLSLSTRPIAPPRTGVSVVDRLAARHLERMRPGLGSGFTASMVQYLAEDRPYLARSRQSPDASPAVLDLAPLPGTPEVKRHEVDRGKLLDGARSAYRMAHLALEGVDAQVVPRLTVVRSGVVPDPSPAAGEPMP
ncbi:patatin-like phospholipase family protein [Saccharothrix texasensis]|uniref:Patatin-like phospholipase n=1 Tax=Saccharothrix texasensis TaxID=103734 RepID=A0A3N1H901_9PSEU|nr:patatin-like phospholipase family protein [Saccharothrix texasensis]ROP38948.1 patatin-like phospholipase [Saccharothrix texasensis]